MKYLHLSCHENYGVFKKSTLPKWKISFYAMINIYLHDGKFFLGTWWKILCSMKIFFYMINFFVNYTIENLIKKIKIFFLDDAIFYGMKKFFHTIKIWFLHDQNIFSRWKIFSLYSERKFVWDEKFSKWGTRWKIFYTRKIFHRVNKYFSYRRKIFFTVWENFFIVSKIFLIV